MTDQQNIKALAASGQMSDGGALAQLLLSLHRSLQHCKCPTTCRTTTSTPSSTSRTTTTAKGASVRSPSLFICCSLTQPLVFIVAKDVSCGKRTATKAPHRLNRGQAHHQKLTSPVYTTPTRFHLPHNVRPVVVVLAYISLLTFFYFYSSPATAGVSPPTRGG